MGKQLPPLEKRRPSKSGDAVRKARIARELAMEPLERMALALRLGRLGRQLGSGRSAWGRR